MWAVAAVAVLAQTLLALEACAIPVKYDATRSKSSFSAHLGLNETKPTFSTQSVVYDDDVLDMVAYRNPNRWVVKVKGRDRGGSVDCGETIAKICAEAPVPKEGVLFDGECIWEDQMSCFFTLEAASGEADIDALLAQYSDDIEFAERDMKVVMEQQSCSYPFPQSSAPWHLDRIDSTATAAPFDGSFGTPQDLLGENVHVYVLDTGLRTTHVEFAGRVGAGANVLPGGGSNWDDNGHGTAVASVAAGTSNGVCKCCVVHGIKCLDSNGDGSYTDVISGLYWVQRNVQRPAVASMSLSGPTSLGINQAIEELYNGGILTIAAAGNENVDACTKSPGSSQFAVTVGASDRSGAGQDIRSDFSNYGTCVNIYAPGSGVRTAHFSGDSASNTKSGTSFSAPAVAGAAALYLSSYPDSSPELQHEKVTQASVSAPTIEQGARLLNLNVLDVCPEDQDPVQCQVSDWTEWSPQCPPPVHGCGRPTQRRSRTILAEPSCGGNVCPATQDVRYCQGDYTPCPSDFPTQWFGTTDQNVRPAVDMDISGRTIKFSPNSTAFSACIDDHYGYQALEGFSGATKLEMGDDSFVEITLGDAGFPYLGNVKQTIFVGSNGYLTLDQGDFSYMVGESGAPGLPQAAGVTEDGEASMRRLLSGHRNVSASTTGTGIKAAFAHIHQDVKRMLAASTNIEGHNQFVQKTAPHWLRQRIAGLYQDMNPTNCDFTCTHGVYFQAKGAGTQNSRLVVTYDRIPLWGMPEETNTFQIVLYTEESAQPGAIQMWWGVVSGVYRPLVGLSPGSGLPQGQIETDLIPDLGTCNGNPLPIVPLPPPVVVAAPAQPFAAPPVTGGGFDFLGVLFGGGGGGFFS